MVMNKRINKKKLVTAIFILILLIIIFASTNPANVPLFVYVLPFLGIAYLLYITVEIAARTFINRISEPKVKIIAVFGAGLPTLLLLLNSIGQLGLKDLLISAGIIIGIVFYFSRTNFIQ